MPKFYDVVKIRKATNCPTCQSFIYQLPIPMTASIEAFLAVFGQTQFPLDKFKVILVDNETVMIGGQIGRTELKIKYKKNTESLKVLVQATLTNWLVGQNIQIE